VTPRKGRPVAATAFWFYDNFLEYHMAITRTRRSSIERRCLSKTGKRVFRGKGSAIMYMVYQAECQARNRKALG
jgi:hypothetical protein